MPSVLSSWPLKALRYQPCTGDVPGSIYTAPGTVIAVAYNGLLLRRGSAYTAAAECINLNFKTETGDRIDALCIS